MPLSWGAVRVARMPRFVQAYDGQLGELDRAALVGAVLYYDDDYDDKRGICYLFRPLLSPIVIIDVEALDEIPDSDYETDALASAVTLSSWHPLLARRLGCSPYMDAAGGRWNMPVGKT